MFASAHSVKRNLPSAQSCWFAAATTASALVVAFGVWSQNWLLLIGALAVPLVLLWPVSVSLGLFAAMLPFDAVSVLGTGRTGMTLTFVAGGIATAVLIVVGFTGDRFITPPKAALWWTLFVLWGITSALWALDPQLSSGHISTSTAFIVMYLVAVSVRMTARELRWIEECIIAGGTAAACYSISQFFSGVFYHGLLSTRSSMIAGGREEDPNQFALALLLPISIGLGRAFSTRNRLERFLLTGASVLMTLALALTMSRGVIAALLVMGLLYANKYRAGWRAVAPLSACLLVLFMLPAVFFERLQGIFASRGAGRLDIWIAGLYAAREHGFLGAGLSNFPVAYTDVAGKAPMFRGFARAPHNIFLGMLVEVGIGGCLCFVLAMRSQLRHAKDVAGRFHEISTPAIFPYLVACYAMLVAGLSLDIVWRKPFWLCWILLAIVTSTSERTIDSRSEI